jgi:anti-sigma factor RsiW
MMADVHSELCRDLMAKLSEYLDGEASDEFCRELEWHMGDCEDCRVLVDTLQKTVSLYRDLPHPTLPSATRRRLYASLDLDAYKPRD